MVYLALNFAGIDAQDNSSAELDDMVAMLRMFGVAATLGQAKDRDRDAATAEVRATLEEIRPALLHTFGTAPPGADRPGSAG